MAPSDAIADRSPLLPVLVTLLLHFAVWTWCSIASRTNLDFPGDMTEAYTWGQHWNWGHFKHPPLTGWITGLWFSVFPTVDASFAILAAFNSTLAIAGFALIVRDLLPAHWIWPCVAAATLTAGTTSMAMRFNPNAVLLLLWPWSLWFILRYLRDGLRRNAILVSVTLALGVLGKYFSLAWCLGVLLVALAHRPWRRRLWSRESVWLIVPGVLLLAPHVIWLLGQRSSSIDYAVNVLHHPVDGAGSPKWASFIGGQLMMPALGIILLVAGSRGSYGTRGTAACPAPPSPSQQGSLPRLPSTIFTALALMPIAVIAAATAATGIRTSPVWALSPGMGILLWVAHRLDVSGRAPVARRIWRTLAVVWTIAVIAAPLYWWHEASNGKASVAEPRAEFAAAVDARIRERGAIAPAWVSGTPELATAVSFYAPFHPRHLLILNFDQEFAALPAITGEEDDTRGFGLIVCRPADAACAARAASLSGTRETITISKEARGHRFEPQSFDVHWIGPNR